MIWHNGLNMFENVWTIWNGTELIDLTWFKALQIIASHRSKKVLNTLSPSLLCDTARLWGNASPLMPRLSNTSPLHIKGSAIEDWIPFWVPTTVSSPSKLPMKIFRDVVAVTSLPVTWAGSHLHYLPVGPWPASNHLNQTKQRIPVPCKGAMGTLEMHSIL